MEGMDRGPSQEVGGSELFEDGNFWRTTPSLQLGVLMPLPSPLSWQVEMKAASPARLGSPRIRGEHHKLTRGITPSDTTRA